MEKLKNIFRGMFQDFFTASAVIFLLAYLIWFWLALESNLIFGIIFLILYVVPTAVYRLLQSRFWLKTIFLIPTAFFWLVNIWFIIGSFPSIRDMTIHNGSIYILTHSHDFLEPVYEGFQLTKWKWGLIPERDSVPGRWGDERFIYDEELRVVEIVRNIGNGDVLVYTDDGKHSRRYEGGLEYRGHLYYSSNECIKRSDSIRNPCEIHQYTMYQCNLDNKSCIPISFQYTGWEWIGYLELNETTNEIDFIVERYPEDAEAEIILVYSYGDHPRCYVDGCEILTSP